MPPIVDRVDFLRKILTKVTLFSVPEMFCRPEICQKCVGGRSTIPTPSALNSCAFSAQLLCSPNVKSWLRPSISCGMYYTKKHIVCKLTKITPSPFPVDWKCSGRFNSLASQSTTIISSSTHAGLASYIGLA